MPAVLIVPLWNWNPFKASNLCTLECSNRTFMELKYSFLLSPFYRLSCSNRTFMELKLLAAPWFWWLLRSSNRTFMELKFAIGICSIVVSEVLIVPLWNWNQEFLKLVELPPRSNRTFMELKFVTYTAVSKAKLVLIVPLWNWNSKEEEEKQKEQEVLIVPLWNWNKGIFVFAHSFELF